MHQWITVLLVFLFTAVPCLEAKLKISFERNILNLKAEDTTYGTVLKILAQHAGLKYQIPDDLKSVRIPIIEIENVDLTTALEKIMEGSRFNFVLIGRPGVRDLVFKLIISGKSKDNGSGNTNSVQNDKWSLDPFSAGSQEQHSEFIKQGQANHQNSGYDRTRLSERKIDLKTFQKKDQLMVKEPYGQPSSTFPERSKFSPSRSVIKSSLDQTSTSKSPIREVPSPKSY
ncbi:MAG: hypothetical protein MK025_03910 [Acidobacteriia bacterium]|nr:hypothetical protein [Terriglobia bacterium]